MTPCRPSSPPPPSHAMRCCVSSRTAPTAREPDGEHLALAVVGPVAQQHKEAAWRRSADGARVFTDDDSDNICEVGGEAPLRNGRRGAAARAAAAPSPFCCSCAPGLTAAAMACASRTDRARRWDGSPATAKYRFFLRPHKTLLLAPVPQQVRRATALCYPCIGPVLPLVYDRLSHPPPQCTHHVQNVPVFHFVKN
jgi:hypothetical protein